MLGISHQIRGHRNAIFVDQHSSVGMRNLEAWLTHFPEIRLNVLSESAADQIVNLIFVPRQKLPAFMIGAERFAVLLQNFRRIKAGIHGKRNETKVWIAVGNTAVKLGNAASDHGAGFYAACEHKTGQPALAQHAVATNRAAHALGELELRKFPTGETEHYRFRFGFDRVVIS